MFKLKIEFNPEKPTKQEHEPEESFLEKIKNIVNKLEGPTDSQREWQYAKAIYKRLCDCNHLPPDGKEAIRLLQPQIERGAQFDSKEGGSLMKGDKMHQWNEDDNTPTNR